MPDLRTLEDIVKQPIPNEILLKYEMWTLQRMGWKLNGEQSRTMRCDVVQCDATWAL